MAAGLLIAFSLSGSKKSPSQVSGAPAVSTLLRGIPQQGNVLGRATAPVTLVEYADLQCPYCAMWARGTFPTLVHDYVRTGKVRIVFRGLAFVGRDSATGLAAALAAARQDRLWHVVEVLYASQGQENTGWLGEGLLPSIAADVPGLDVQQMMSDRRSQAVGNAALQAEEAARTARITGTPSFEIGRTGGPMRRLEIQSLDASAFRTALDSLLSS